MTSWDICSFFILCLLQHFCESWHRPFSTVEHFFSLTGLLVLNGTYFVDYDDNDLKSVLLASKHDRLISRLLYSSPPPQKKKFLYTLWLWIASKTPIIEIAILFWYFEHSLYYTTFTKDNILWRMLHSLSCGDTKNWFFTGNVM